jgi:enoyl-CoA hydratase/carnithine racemase
MKYTYQLLNVNIESGVATVYLNRPPMNPFNAQLVYEVQKCGQDLGQDDRVRAIVITGGEKNFSAGADLKDMQGLTPRDISKSTHNIQIAFSTLENIPKPVIAAINGYAVGGGCELALCCDFRYAHEKALIGQPEILLGLLPAAGGCLRLSRLIGPAKAKEMVYTGKIYTARECFQLGLVQKVIKSNTSVIEEAQKTARIYAKGPAVALAMAKTAINRGLECSINEALILEAHGISLCFATEDHKIGIQSFLEKGPGKAKFLGK